MVELQPAANLAAVAVGRKSEENSGRQSAGLKMENVEIFSSGWRAYQLRGGWGKRRGGEGVLWQACIRAASQAVKAVHSYGIENKK